LGDIEGPDFLSPISSDQHSFEDGEVEGMVPNACTASQISVLADAAVVGGAAVSFTLRTGGNASSLGNTGLSCTIFGGSNSCRGNASQSLGTNTFFDVQMDATGSALPSSFNAIIAIVCN
jgi:hypothetical protein